MSIKGRLKHTLLFSSLFLATLPAGAQDNLGTGDDLREVNSATPKAGGEVTYTLSRDMTNWNVTSALGNNAVVRSATLPLVPSAFVVQPDFTLAMNTDLLESAELTSTDPQVVTYKIRPEAVWNDGTPISGEDFIYLWKTTEPA